MAELDAALIAKAGLAVADERGADGFTMRAVADVLGVTPMALYHHVADKSALVGLVVDLSLTEIEFPQPTGIWQEDLWLMAEWMRRVAFAHPAVSELRRQYRVWTPSVLPLTERWFSVWQQSGLGLEAAIRAGSSTSMAIAGMVEAELRFTESGPPDEQLLSLWPNARMAFLGEHSSKSNFELAIRSMIEGVHARLSAEA